MVDSTGNRGGDGKTVVKILNRHWREKKGEWVHSKTTAASEKGKRQKKWPK